MISFPVMSYKFELMASVCELLFFMYNSSLPGLGNIDVKRAIGLWFYLHDVIVWLLIALC